ncbi:class I SAM-dependent methyltransferase [Candidatus Kaiserbacteria bacterium]|nr:class I SAM-dependent methyltransferase [Candidatus Kaiserbacteria bacterium]
MQQTAHHAPLNTEGFAHPKKNVGALGIQSGMRVADFGAGSGAYVLAIAERLGGSGAVYAIDVQRDLLRRIHNEAVRRGYKNVEVIWADLEVPRASKLADSSIDLVLISNLLFQVPDKLPVLREARRIIKSTGTVAIVDWSNPEENASRSNEAGSFGPRKEDVVSREMALDLARRSSLELIREFPAGAHHYGLVLGPVPYAAI